MGKLGKEWDWSGAERRGTTGSEELRRTRALWEVVGGLLFMK